MKNISRRSMHDVEYNNKAGSTPLPTPCKAPQLFSVP